MFKIARENSKKWYALVMLLFNGALRIQDAVGPKFSKLTDPQPNARGFRKVKFFPKKSNAREVFVG